MLMTYFDPHIYNRENLKPRDRAELDYWLNAFNNAIYNATDDMELGDGAIDQLKADVVSEYTELLKDELGLELQDNLVAFIEGYDEDIKKRVTYTDYKHENGATGDFGG